MKNPPSTQPSRARRASANPAQGTLATTGPKAVEKLQRAPGHSLATTSQFSDDDKLRGQQITEAFREANGAVKRVLIFGAMMLVQRDLVDSARGVNSATRGPTTKGDGLKAWLKAFAPEVAASEGSAYRYMGLAEGLRDALKLGKKADLTLLLTAPDEELSESLRKKQAEIDKLIEGKSQRQLIFEFGKAEPKLKGGHRTKSGPPETPEEKFKRHAQDQHDKFVATFESVKFRHDDKALRFASDVEIELACDFCEEFITAARAWLKLPRRERAAIAVEEAAQ